MTIYAVNVGDIFNRDPVMNTFLIAPVIPSRKLVKCDPALFDETGVILECGEEQAAAIVALIRKKYPPHVVRTYESKTGKTWKRIGAKKQAATDDDEEQEQP